MFTFIKRLLLYVVIICCLSTHSSGAITIDSIKTTNSTCPNNGSIKVYVTTNDKLVVYSIIAGPIPPIQQTNNLFNSLPPGKYTVLVTDGAKDSAKATVSITGNYQIPKFNPITISPYCQGGSDGKIICKVDSGTGNSPFSWQLIAPTSLKTLQQPNDTFNNLPPGDYKIAITDACGSYSEVTSKIKDATKGISIFNTSVSFASCDTVLLKYFVELPDSRATKLTFKYKTKKGIFIPTPGDPTTTIDSSYFNSSATLIVKQLFPTLTYGDSITISVTDICGNTNSVTINLTPLILNPQIKFTYCGKSAILTFKNVVSYITFKSPINYSVINKSTNTTISDSTIDSIFTSLPFIDTLPIKTVYQLTVTDGCGKVFQLIDTIPSPDTPTIYSYQKIPYGCIDSVAEININTKGFGSGEELILLSGPKVFGSTKAGFAYKDSYEYPDTINNNTENFTLLNVAVGTYQFEVIDSCGNHLSDSFIVTPNDVSDLGINNKLVSKFYYKKQCAGENIIYFSHIGNIHIMVQNINPITRYFENNYSSSTLTTDSITGLPSGQYQLIFTDKSLNNSAGVRIDKKDTCFVTQFDTLYLNIPDYQAPSIRAYNSILCNSNIHVELIADVLKGVPPYLYEIYKGPETFPLQKSNVFTLSKVGNYTARIFDACGINATTSQLTIDTLSLPHIGTDISACNSSIKLYLDSSAFYTYTWVKPDRTPYNGDTINIPYVTPADTGIYKITKVVKIGGCTDTIQNSYHLYGGNYFVNNFDICPGNIVNVGNHPYTNPGTYVDTFLLKSNCDSIVQTNISYLVVPLPKYFTINGCNSIVYNGRTYLTSTLLTDTIKAIEGCDSIYKQTKIIVTSNIPSISISATNDAICMGDPVTFTALPIYGGNDPAYQWKVNNSNTGTNADILATTSLNNGDQVSCTLTSNLSCVTTKTAVSNAIEMSVSNGNCDTVYVPNAFNPLSYINSRKETLHPYTSGTTIRVNYFKVYNRFGYLVFEGHDFITGWDGRINGILQDVGTFVWMLEYKKISGIKKTIKGTSVLIH